MWSQTSKPYRRQTLPNRLWLATHWRHQTSHRHPSSTAWWEIRVMIKLNSPITKHECCQFVEFCLCLSRDHDFFTLSDTYLTIRFELFDNYVESNQSYWVICVINLVYVVLRFQNNSSLRNKMNKQKCLCRLILTKFIVIMTFNRIITNIDLRNDSIEIRTDIDSH